MKDYIKPTFVLAGLFPVALAAGCTTTDTDLAIIKQFAKVDASTKGLFATTEIDCNTKIPLTQYCKFTSEGEGVLKVLTS